MLETGNMAEIWEKVRKTGQYEGISVAQEILDSWTRCEAYGVDPYKARCDAIVTEHELTEKRSRNQGLIKQGLVMMGHLHKFTEGSGFIFALGDRENCALELIGDRESLDIGRQVGVTVGANWSEPVMGTNNPALAQALRQPVQVFGYEHYCRCLSFGTGASSPIFDEEGDIIGFLSLAGPNPLTNRHTLGMVIAACRAIERQISLQNAYWQSEMANLHKTAIMDSITDGVLTLDREGRVTHLNTQAARGLGLDEHSAAGQKLFDMMEPHNELFFSAIYENKRMYAEPLTVRHKDKTVKQAVSCTPLTGKDGSVLGTVVILQPIQRYTQLIRRAIGTRAQITFDKIMGENTAFRYSVKCAQIAARSDSNVLLLGESGVGKEMFAQAIHNASSRASEPFLAINCAALPRELVASELFGYEEGAFTGARKGGNQGKFELADQGTIFLDEIGELPLDMQGSLLRVLEEGQITRLGGGAAIPVNVRIIAATNKNLREEVGRRSFRADLFYRLGVIDVTIPPLRERKDDIPALAEYFIASIGPRLGKQIAGVDQDVLNVLTAYPWPGNVRELSNVIERMINMAVGPTLGIDELPPEMRQAGLRGTRAGRSPNMKNVNETAIRESLARHNGNKNQAAVELGISRTSLYRKMRSYRIPV